MTIKFDKIWGYTPFLSIFPIFHQLQRAASKVDRTALKVHTPMRSTALMARSRAVPVDSLWHKWPLRPWVTLEPQ